MMVGMRLLKANQTEDLVLQWRRKQGGVELCLPVIEVGVEAPMFMAVDVLYNVPD